jgi:hypothetical protein
MTKSVNAKNAFKVQKREHMCEDQENDELNLALSKTKLWVSTSLPWFSIKDMVNECHLNLFVSKKTRQHNAKRR